jgi:hypothetical protein
MQPHQQGPEQHHPTMPEIILAFERLSERVEVSPNSRLNPLISASLGRAMEELRRFVPGLDPVPDPDAAKNLHGLAMTALNDGDARAALAHALSGLSCAPHHPQLWFLAGSACFEYGAVEDSISIFRHTLWIHPGHKEARTDLKVLLNYLKERSGHETTEPGNILRAESLPPWEKPLGPEITAAYFKDILDKYNYLVVADGTVRFTLPKGLSYVALFDDARTFSQAYCPHDAICNLTFNWFVSDRRKATIPAPADLHESVALHENLRGKTREEQQSELKDNGCNFASLEAAAAAHVLHYCATGEDFFRHMWVRTKTPVLALGSFAAGLDVSDCYGDHRDDATTAVGSRKI